MKRRLLAWICGGLLGAITVSAALAEGPDEWRKTETPAAEQKITLRQHYTGVKPGQGNNLPRVEELKGKTGTWVTWPGFMPLENGGSRLFIQATESLHYSISDKGLRVTLTFKNAKVHLSNNRNPLVTTHFNTPLKRAYLKRHKKSTELVLELKVNTTPEISQMTDADGYQYLFVDFAPGNYPLVETSRPLSTYSRVGGETDDLSAEAPSEDGPLVEEMNP